MVTTAEYDNQLNAIVQTCFILYEEKNETIMSNMSSIWLYNNNYVLQKARIDISRKENICEIIIINLSLVY